MKVSGLTLLLIWIVIITIGMGEAVFSESINQYSGISYALLIGIPTMVYWYKARQKKENELRANR